MTASAGAAGDVEIPGAAVIRAEGKAWVYIEQAAGQYVRYEVTTDRPAPSGWLAGLPFHAGDRVVTRGAEVLFSEESKSKIQIGV